MSSDDIGRGTVIGVTGEVTVLNHQHPAFALLNQPETKGFAQGVTGSQQRGITLTTQQITRWRQRWGMIAFTVPNSAILEGHSGFAGIDVGVGFGLQAD